ncbi:MAG: hypothetical protein AAF208_13345 [Cyanobacteria bacterium P01_A01_bin.45]
MFINFKRYLFLLASILAITLSSPKFSLAASVEVDTTFLAVNTQAYSWVAKLNSYSAIELTPQISQQLQGIRHRRSREIKAILTSSQKIELEHYLRNGNTLSQAIDKLDLQPRQIELIQAIVKLTDLKIQATLSKYLDLTGQSPPAELDGQ